MMHSFLKSFMSNMTKGGSPLSKQLQNVKVVGESGGGLVRAHFNGMGKLERLELDPMLQGKDLSMISDLVVTACNEGSDKVREKIAEEAMDSDEFRNIADGVMKNMPNIFGGPTKRD